MGSDFSKNPSGVKIYSNICLVLLISYQGAYHHKEPEQQVIKKYIEEPLLKNKIVFDEIRWRNPFNFKYPFGKQDEHFDENIQTIESLTRESIESHRYQFTNIFRRMFNYFDQNNAIRKVYVPGYIETGENTINMKQNDSGVTKLKIKKLLEKEENAIVINRTSTYLKDKTELQKIERYARTITHELGHVFGVRDDNSHGCDHQLMIQDDVISALCKKNIFRFTGDQISDIKYKMTSELGLSVTKCSINNNPPAIRDPIDDR